jgi:hypothetical protein
MFQVELYQGPSDALFVQARAIARTQIVERTVILLREEDGSRLESIDNVEEATQLHGDPSVAQKIHAAAAAWWIPVISAKLTDQDQEPFKYYWPHNVRGVLPWPGTWITAYRSTAGSQPVVGVFLGGREHPLSELLRALTPDWNEIAVGLPEGTTFEDGRKLEVTRPTASFPDDESARSWLVEAIDKFVNQIRPRAAALAGTL